MFSVLFSLGKVITAKTYNFKFIIVSVGSLFFGLGVQLPESKVVYGFWWCLCVCLFVIGGAHNGMYINTSIFFLVGLFLRLNYLVLVLVFIIYCKKKDWTTKSAIFIKWCEWCFFERGGTWDNITDSKLRIKTVSYGVRLTSVGCGFCFKWGEYLRMWGCEWSCCCVLLAAGPNGILFV